MSGAQATLRLVVAVAVVVALAVSGCTVSTNDEPQAAGNLFATFLETTTTTTTSTPDEAGKAEPLYFLETTAGGATRLKLVERSFDVGADIEDVLQSLFTVPPDTEGAERPEERDLTSAIPTETAVLQSATLSSDSTVLIVDVAGLFGNINRSPLRNALAQIVWTATKPPEDGSSPEIRSVLFRRNGEPTTVIVGNGGEVDRPVDRRDYTSLG